MILFITAMLVLVAGLLFGTQMAGHKGYVLVVIDNTNYELSVTTALVGIVLLFLAIILIAWLLFSVLQWNVTTRRWLAGRGRKKAESIIAKGFTALASGDYKQACSLLSKGASSSASPMISYLAAFKAAWELGDLKLQNQYLQKAEAHANNPQPVLLTLAKYQVKNKQFLQAEDTLNELKALKANNSATLQLQYSVLIGLQQWQALLELIPTLLKSGIISNTEQQELIVTAYQGRFNELAKQNDHQALAALWNGLPRKDKKLEAVRFAIVTAFIKAGDSKAAYQLLGDLISNDPHSPYLPLLTQLELDDYYPALEQVRSLYEKYENTPELQSVFGQLLIKSKQWQEAIPVLKFVLSVRESNEDHLALSLALENTGQYQEALLEMKASRLS